MRRRPIRNAGALDSGLFVMTSQHVVPRSAVVVANLANRLALQTHAAILVGGRHLNWVQAPGKDLSQA
jgi:hypothetical protein